MRKSVNSHSDSLASSPSVVSDRSRGRAAKRGWLESLTSRIRQPAKPRSMRIEPLETRRMMTADPIHVGVVYLETDYLESDVGSDSRGDKFLVSFTGGAAGTKLTELRIKTDKDGDGLSIGDLIFDTAPGGRGKNGWHPFKLTPGQSEQATAEVADGGQELIIRPLDFQTGDTLSFTIDVDEVLRMNADLAQFNQRLDVIASGQEFQDSILEAKFDAPNYDSATATSIFLNDYGNPDAEFGLNLPPDESSDPNSLPNRSAAAVGSIQQRATPAAISGFVYRDDNDSGTKDTGEIGLSGVRVRLEPIDTVELQSTLTTTTKTDGSYEFRGVMPGRYRIVELDQPAGLQDGRDGAGTINGRIVGSAVNPGEELNNITLAGGDRGINYNFGELPLGSIGGFVYLAAPGQDCTGNHETDGSTPVAGAEVRLVAADGKVVATKRTGTDGSYRFDQLLKGVYSIVEVTPSGLIDGGAHAGNLRTLAGGLLVGAGQSIGGGRITNINLGAGAKGEHYDFCEAAPGSLSGVVYHDRDNDGVKDTGEESIENVLLSLIDSLGNEISQTRTDNQGRYTFANLNPDTYRIVETQPTGFIDGKDTVGTIAGARVGRDGGDNDSLVDIVLRQGLHGADYNFGERKSASISGRVHVDLDDDCKFDPNEQTLEGVLIELKDATGKTVGTTRTDANGKYRFDQLIPGTYTVVEQQPQGYFDGGAVAGSAGGTVGENTIRSITLASGVVAQNYDFCERPPAGISGFVYVDLDQDCVRDAGERGLSGVLIELMDSDGKVIQTTRTGSDGRYSFTNLRAGEYFVRESQPVGYFHGGQTAGSHGGDDSRTDLITAINAPWGESLTEYNFCELLPSELSGVVYVDRDEDCFRDPSEEGLAGVLIELLNANGSVVDSTTTDAEGKYSFTNLRTGEYTVRETQPIGYFQGGQVAGSGGGDASKADVISAITIAAGQSLINYNFCELLPSELSGVVYVDRDADCVRDAGEEGLAGVLIELIDSRGNVIETTRTDAAGKYLFTNLRTGEYTVRETQPVGYFQGGQVAGSGGGDDSKADVISSIVIASGQSLINYDFCELLPSELSGVVYVDRDADCIRDAGEEGLAGVVIELVDSQGNVIETTRTDASGKYVFKNLRAGDYTVRETQPVGYFQGGQVAGSGGGDASKADVISAISIAAGQSLTDYDFCELLPSELSGVVYVDRDADCVRDAGEEGLAGVVIELFDNTGRLVATTSTAADGTYSFRKLPPGIYTVRETQPAGYYQGGQVAGSGGGNASVDDVISAIAIGAGQTLVNYDFCELLPASISGKVFSDVNTNSVFDEDELPIAGVIIELINPAGDVIATTRTDASGCYTFDRLPPGTYRVRETQPDGYFHGGQNIGSLGGRIAGFDNIGEIVVRGNDAGEHYDFPELPPATISGYVFQDGAALQLKDAPDPLTLREYRDGQLTNDDTRLDSVRLELRDVTGNRIDAATDLIGGGSGFIEVVTDENGYYEFSGLRPTRTYSVYQVQPSGFVDSLDTAGTTGGLALNLADLGVVGMNSFVQSLAVGSDPNFDAIFNISVLPGQISQSNNFSEIVIVDPPVYPPPAAPTPPELNRPGAPIETFATSTLPYVYMNRIDVLPPPFTNDEWEVSWHLSVINGGFPRGDGQNAPGGMLAISDARMKVVQVSSRGADPKDAVGKLPDVLLKVDLAGGRWQIMPSSGDFLVRPSLAPLAQSPSMLSRSTSKTPALTTSSIGLGHVDGIALTGDFDGDGIDEAVLFVKGQWFVDFNGDGRWDAGDLWLRMGTELDRPVVGDWDGDGKDDIGIFGRRWQNDDVRIRRDPGLPDPANQRRRQLQREDLVHRETTEQERQQRVILRGKDGELLADAVDHVFQYGEQVDTPLAGDWNGDGIDQIGVFRSGQWLLDEDGDGRWTNRDRPITFGEPGDEPFVGDFDGDGIDEIGVVRGDVWIIDSDGDRKLTGNDRQVRVPRDNPNSQPIVGDFDGDEIDDMGYYDAAG